MKFVIIASTLSGNKGAAAMLETSLQTLGKHFPAAEFTLLTVYPKADQQLNSYPNLKILSATPLFLALLLNPAALLVKLFPKLRNLLCRWIPQLNALNHADALLDQGGITFTDGREIFLLYNVATILPALLMGTKVIKCAQALGPFKNPINHFIAKLILPRLNLIIARGNKTFDYLKTLKLDNIALATDYAFALNVESITEAEKQLIINKTKKNAENPHLIKIGISPSIVMKKKCDELGINYIGLMQWFINELQKQNYRVLLIPHSTRIGTDKMHNNDLPLCRTLVAGLDNPELCVFFDEEMSSQALRHLIGQTNFFIACRFHAMISSLAMGVPTLVLGWSHKYSEILELFDLSEYGIATPALNRHTLWQAFSALVEQSVSVTVKLQKNMPYVRTLACSHVKLIEDQIIVP